MMNGLGLGIMKVSGAGSNYIPTGLKAFFVTNNSGEQFTVKDGDYNVK